MLILSFVTARKITFTIPMPATTSSILPCIQASAGGKKALTANAALIRIVLESHGFLEPVSSFESNVIPTFYVFFSSLRNFS